MIVNVNRMPKSVPIRVCGLPEERTARRQRRAQKETSRSEVPSTTHDERFLFAEFSIRVPDSGRVLNIEIGSLEQSTLSNHSPAS